MSIKNSNKETTHITVVYGMGTKYEVWERVPIDNIMPSINKQLDSILKQRLKDND